MLNSFMECLDLRGQYIQVENGGSYYVERRESRLFLYFEWSNGKVDWKNNFNFPAKPYRDMKNLWFCHRGFLKVWKSIEPHISQQILDPSITEIYIVGYSHGGAVAQLCHEYCKFNRPEIDVFGYGFGAPRVVWGPCRRVVKDRFKEFYVIRNGRDLVTHLPPVLFGFHHVCKVIKIGKSVGLIKDHYDTRYIAALRVGEDCGEVE